MRRNHGVVARAVLAGLCLLPVLGAEPLLLTPLLEAGRAEEAVNLSLVPPLFDGDHTESYAGYFTVNKRHDSNLFFWYFPAENNTSTAPVILWLQGGPGVSSMMGLFVENGPYSVSEDYTVHKRAVYWSQNHHMIYIDNPVGTGFSFTRDEDGYSKTVEDVARNVYKALLQFFELFPLLRYNSFYLAGQSYGGKYAVAVARKIHLSNRRAKNKMNLQGLMIGNGFIDPKNMMNYGDLLIQLGIIDDIQLKHFHAQEELIRKHIKREKWDVVFLAWGYLIGADYLSYLYNETGYSYHFNFLYRDKEPDVTEHFIRYVEGDSLRAAVHVGDELFHAPGKVAARMVGDFFRSARPWLEELLEEYRVLVYDGQLDVICAHPLVEGYLRKLKWSGEADFRREGRSRWTVSGQLAGYVKSAGNLTVVLVRNAGHLVPANQPAWALSMISAFTSDSPFA